MVVSVFVVIFVLLSMMPSCATSAHVKITTKNGKSIYVNRLAQGLDDEVVWITTKSGKCRYPKKADINLGYSASTLYYKEMPDGTLTFYKTWQPEIPNGFPKEVKFEVVHPKDFDKVIQELRNAGELKEVFLDLPKSDPCRFGRGWWWKR
jgi:ligand-binding sensor domain-containing protein